MGFADTHWKCHCGKYNPLQVLDGPNRCSCGTLRMDAERFARFEAEVRRLRARIAELEAEVAKAKATATTDAHYVVEKDQQRARAVEEVQRLFEEERE